ncbi:MAG TPA: protein kinase [Thermoanaerobaculia bacterium]|nr:protein kinase [Thermoanaerobaculia bacterium]
MSTLTREEVVGPYAIIRPLGAGGMGEVFLAYDASLERHIAIKLLPRDVADDPALIARLRREARLASSLNHPNIVTIYSIDETADSVYLAMEYVEGRTLRDLLGSGPLPLKKTLQIAAQVAEGLAAAHKRGLVHRDLKPENVMITTEGVVKILDFGLAKSIPLEETGDSSHTLSREGAIAGTLSYMSPEQARGHALDFRSDQFGFGAILYEMLSGTKPFVADSAIETLFLIARDDPAPLSTVAPSTPPPLRWIVERCLGKDPEERYASTYDLARDLRDVRDHLSEATVTAPITPLPALPAQERRKHLLPLAAALLLTVGLAAGFLASHWLRRPAPPAIPSFSYVTYSGLDYSPAVAPDGKTIAFSSFRDGTSRIWLKQIAGGSEAALTTGPADDFPRFSPDGASVLFVRGNPGGSPNLFRIPVVGGEARKLVDNASTGDWSADGKRLAFVRPAGSQPNLLGSLYVAGADGTNPRLLAAFTDMTINHPRWSPDGRSIAVVGARGRAVANIAIIDVETRRIRQLALHSKAGEVSSVVWSRDSSELIYARAESVEAVVGSPARIYRHDVKNDEPHAIAWAPNNGLILDRLGNGELVFDARSPSDNLLEINLKKGAEGQKWLTRGNSSDRQPVYSPDGKSIVFSSNRSGNLDLWRLSPETGVVQRITEDTAEDWDPGFTGDGKIIWSSGRSGNLEIWIAEGDGSNARQLSNDGVDAENPVSTPDGKWVIYNSFHPEKRGVWKVPVGGGSAVQVVSGRTAIPEVSPDGQYVAYLADGRTPQAQLRVARLADGKDTGFSVPVRARRRTSAILGRSRWMPGSNAIAYLAQDEEGINGVFVQDFEPGRDTAASRRKLGGFDRYRATESFGISPDGERMTIAGWEQLFSIMAVKGLPRFEEP